MTIRLISPYDQWILDNAGQVVGIQLTDSSVATTLPDGNPVTKVDFILNPGVTAEAGELVWNPVEETLDLGLMQGAMLQIGQEMVFHVENHTGTDIPDGTPCQFAGTSGNSGKLRVAPWDGTQASFTFMGLATTEIPDSGDTGYVTAFGKVRGIQTDGGNYGETWEDGDVIYAGGSGGLTNVVPEAPGPNVVVAAVISAHPKNGTLFVRPQIGSSLALDELVQLSALASRDVLQYNATTERFENGPPVLTAAASANPSLNRDVVLELASDTSLTIKVKGSDGTIRSATLTLA